MPLPNPYEGFEPQEPNEFVELQELVAEIRSRYPFEADGLDNLLAAERTTQEKLQDVTDIYLEARERWDDALATEISSWDYEVSPTIFDDLKALVYTESPDANIGEHEQRPKGLGYLLGRCAVSLGTAMGYAPALRIFRLKKTN